VQQQFGYVGTTPQVEQLLSKQYSPRPHQQGPESVHHGFWYLLHALPLPWQHLSAFIDWQLAFDPDAPDAIAQQIPGPTTPDMHPKPGSVLLQQYIEQEQPAHTVYVAPGVTFIVISE
jgi:hypothetical protein